MFRRRAVSTYLTALAVLGLIALAGGVARAGSIEERLTASDAASGAEFGIVAVDDDTILVGAPHDDDNGSVYVYVRCRGTWRERQKLTASDGETDDRFGSAVALDGGTLAVSGGGAVYVFTRDPAGNWSEKQILTASDQEAGDLFGISIALSGDFILVGSSSDDVGSLTDCGSAYVFTRDSAGEWSQQARLTAAFDAAEGDRFGQSVAISDDTALVGAHLADLDKDTADTGAAYVFVRDAGGNWVPEQKLTAKQERKGDFFGISVALDGDTALVGATGVDDFGFPDVGAAYVFTRTGSAWAEQARLDDSFSDNAGLGCSVAVVGDAAIIGGYGDWFDYFFGSHPKGIALVFRRDAGVWTRDQYYTPADLAKGDWFGYTVAFDGATAVIGRIRDDFDGLTDAGSVEVYGYVEETKLTASDAALKDEFGVVAVDGDTIIVGAMKDDDEGTDSGSLYAFLRAEDGTWEEKQKLTASDGAAGDVLGYVLALHGDTFVAASAFGEAVYVFTRDATGKWSEQQKLTASDGAPIGSSIDLDGDTFIVGARGGDVGGVTDCGSAYVFVRDPQTGQWSEQSRLAADDGAESDQLGRSIALSGDTVVIGAHLADLDQGRTDAGAAYVFVRDAQGNWTQQAKLTAKDASAYDGFGISAALDGDTALVGSPGVDIGSEPSAGAVIVFERVSGVWTEHATLNARYPRQDAQLGNSVAFADDVAVVGAYFWFGGRGTAYVFHGGGTAWTNGYRLGPELPSLDTWFGHTVAFDGDTAVIGAIRDDVGGQNRGAAFVYEYFVPKLEILPLSFPDSTSGLSWLGQPEVVGGTPPRTWDVSSGTLPVSGGIDAETGAIDGIWGTPGQYDFTLRVRAICGHEATSDHTVTVSAWPTITTTSLPEGTTGRPYTIALAGTGGTQPNAWTVTSGSLPIPGTLDPVTGSLSGDALAPGDYDFTVRLIDSAGAYHDASYTVTINDVPTITSPSESVSICNRPYDCCLTVADGTAPFTWSVADGTLPWGLVLDAATGDLSGTPTNVECAEFTIRVTDHCGATAEKELAADTAPLANLAQKKHVENLPGGLFDRPQPVCTALELVEGTKLLVSAKRIGKGELPLTLALLDANGNTLDLGTALKVKSKIIVLKGYVVPATGRYYLQFTKTASVTGGVRLTIKAIAPKRVSGSDAVAPGGTFDVECGALTGAFVTVTVKAAKGSTALPTILSVRNEAGDELLVPDELKLKKKFAVLKMRTPVDAGDLTIRVGARDGTSGQMVWTVKIKEPKAYNYARPGDPAGFER